MWVCNLCRKQQEILTKSGAWFYGSGPGQVRGVFEGGPQGKKAKLQDPSLYPYQGASGDLTPVSDRNRPHGGLLPRQASLDNGSGLRYAGPTQTRITSCWWKQQSMHMHSVSYRWKCHKGALCNCRKPFNISAALCGDGRNRHSRLP